MRMRRWFGGLLAITVGALAGWPAVTHGATTKAKASKSTTSKSTIAKATDSTSFSLSVPASVSANPGGNARIAIAVTRRNATVAAITLKGSRLPADWTMGATANPFQDNTTAVDYKLGVAGTTAKDYFFDGSVGIYQSATGTNPPTFIYPTQRRGGRMVYAFDVTIPTSNPTLKWRHGCPNLTDDTGCDTGFSQMGQTWSTPNVAFINGYSPDKSTKPVVVMGGGYDSCEDADVLAPSCGSTKGNVVYFIDGDTGALITSFATTRAVAADVNMVDLNNDGLVDYAYVADVGGNIYRIDFVSSPTTLTALPYPTSTNNTSDISKWFMHRVANTNSVGQGRKFLFGPGLFPTGTSNYLAIVSGDREHPLIGNYPYTALPNPNKAYVYKDDLTSTASTASVDLDLDSGMMNVTDITTST